MGFYLRKSVAVGPFRFNLSGSGVGMSVGVRGLRLGTGPRGNYVRMGRGGVYYQQTFHSPAAPRVAPRVLPSDRRFNNNPRIPICLYDELHFRTASGLNEVLQLSRTGIGEGFASAVRHLGTIG